MMVVLQLHTSSKASRRPGKSSPAVFAFYDPGPLLRDFTKNIYPKEKPSAALSPPLGSGAEDFAKPMSSEPAPSHRPWIGALGATPVRRALPYHAAYKLNAAEQHFFGQLQVRSCRIRGAASKTTLESQNARAQAQTGGDVVGRPSS